MRVKGTVRGLASLGHAVSLAPGKHRPLSPLSINFLSLLKKALWKVPQGLLKGKFPVYSASVTAMAPVRAAAVRGAWGAKLPAASAAR